MPTNETGIAFDMKDFEIQPIACNQSDLGWNLTLPEVINPEKLNYTLSFTDETGNFIFDEIENKITLHETFEAQLIKSQNCPSQEYFVLQYDFLV